MAYLPLANILHHKLSSLLSALGIGMGICMLITLGGLSRGSLYEVARRWESVDADLLVLPETRADVSMLTGAGLSDKLADVLARRMGDTVERTLPVFLWRMKLGGQDQMVVGAAGEDLPWLLHHEEALEGTARFRPRRPWDEILDEQLAAARAAYIRRHGDEEGFIFDPAAEPFARAGWFRIIIDQRLADAGDYEVGQRVTAAGHEWTIAGIVPAGVLARVFIPRRTAQFLFAGSSGKSTVLFVRLRDGVDQGPAARRIAEMTGQKVGPLDTYRSMLVSQFGIMFVYVDAVNALALLIAFLFIMVTLYTMVLQRTREIAILKASGASNAFIIRQVLAESVLLTAAGFVLGVGLSFLAAWGIETARPLLTVQISAVWIGWALLAAAAGACVSAVYPAWRATRVDMLSALTYE